MSKVSVAAPTVEEIAAHLEEIIKLEPSGDPPSWAAANLTFGQLRVLFLLRDEGPMSVGALAERFGVTLASASETIDRLARRELVSRHHRENDRRVVECQLTDQGTQVIEEMSGARLAGMRRMLGVLTTEELTEFDRLIRLIGARLRDARASGAPVRHSAGGCG